jgi:hypothetical protein
MKKIKLLAIAGLSAIAMSSCNKEEVRPASRPSKNPPATTLSEKSVNSVWGIGSDNRVYRWNGTSWDEPNAAARLTRISVSQDASGGVWGTSSGNNVFIWNGTSWGEPNTSARMTRISAYSNTIAFGVGNVNADIYKTTNGGLSWSSIPKTGLPVSSSGQWGLISISTVDGVNAVGVAFDFLPYTYDPILGTWSLMSGSAPYLAQISRSATAFWATGCSSVGALNYQVWKGPSWVQPNPAAGLRFISTSINDDVWGLGSDNRVYKWNGSSWSEPNSAARLVYISSGTKN